jgi:hypothetical protein
VKPCTTLVWAYVWIAAVFHSHADIQYHFFNPPLYHSSAETFGSIAQGIDLNGDGLDDYTIAWSVFGFGMRPEGLNRYLITYDPPPNIGGSIHAVEAGFVIGSSSASYPVDWWDATSSGFPDIPNTAYSMFSGCVNVGCFGEFYSPTPKYAALEFRIGDNVHYGWIKVQDRVLFSYAYESEPGASIIAGMVPEPSSFPLVLAGLGYGLHWLRRRGTPGCRVVVDPFAQPSSGLSKEPY